MLKYKAPLRDLRFAYYELFDGAGQRAAAFGPGHQHEDRRAKGPGGKDDHAHRHFGSREFQEHVLDREERHGGDHQRDAAQVLRCIVQGQGFLIGTPSSSSRCPTSL